MGDGFVTSCLLFWKTCTFQNFIENLICWPRIILSETVEIIDEFNCVLIFVKHISHSSWFWFRKWIRTLIFITAWVLALSFEEVAVVFVYIYTHVLNSTHSIIPSKVIIFPFVHNFFAFLVFVQNCVCSIDVEDGNDEVLIPVEKSHLLCVFVNVSMQEVDNSI